MKESKIGLREAMSIGIGGMVGSGIFAVLGLAVSLAKGGTPVSFLIAGVIAFVTSYSYVKLSIKYPQRGGTVNFINHGFGRGVFSGAINNLLWISYIIMLSLYASAFGSYAPNLMELSGDRSLDAHIYTSFIVVVATIINYFSIEVVGRIEKWAVVIKLVILISFVFIGAYGLIGNPYLSQLSTSNWEGPIQLVAAGMVIFVAYEGFELIANAAPDIENPKINIPKAFYYSVIFVIFLYVVIAIITVGSLPFEIIDTAEDYVLAEAAKPMMGQMGFTIITIAALVSTFSAINASLYGGSQVSYENAEEGELPHHLCSKVWGQPEGLLITAIVTFVAANILPLESISIAGSVGFLLIFAIVNFAGYRLFEKINANKWIPLAGFFLCLTALVSLITQQFATNKEGVFIAIGLIVFSFIMEFLFKKFWS